MWLCGLRFKSRKKHYEVAYQTVHQPYNSPAKNESEAKETDKLSGSLPRETYNSIASTTKENEQQPCNTPPVGSGGDNNVLQHVMSTPSNAPLQDEDKEEEIVLLAAAPSVSTRLKEGAKQVLGSSGVGDILVFDAARTVLYSNIPKLDEGELPAIASVFADRTKAIMKGIILQVRSKCKGEMKNKYIPIDLPIIITPPYSLLVHDSLTLCIILLS